MTNMSTQEPVRVLTGGTAGPYMMIPVDQLESIQQTLTQNGIRFWMDDNALSINGSPYIALINLGREANAIAIQAILDQTPVETPRFSG